MGSSGGTATQPQTITQTSQTSDPWSGAQPAMSQALSGAMSLYNLDRGYIPYSGSTLSPLDPNLDQGIGAQANIAKDYIRGTPGVQAARTLGQQQIESQGLSPQMQALLGQVQGQNNPYLEGVINRQVAQSNAAASGMGRYGSGAHDAAIAQAIAPTLAQDYARRQQMQQDILTGGLQRAGQWSQLMPTLDEAQYAPAERLAAAGQFYQSRQQAALDDYINRYNATQAWPWEQVARLNAIATGSGGLGGTKVGTVNTTGPATQVPSTTQRLFGGAVAGAGLGSMFGPVGTGVGALGGGLLGLM